VKPILTFLYLMTLAMSGNAQLVDYQQYQLNRPSLQDVPGIEKKMRGKKNDYNFNITVSKNYFPGAANLKLANPLVYNRPSNKGKVEVSYFYSQPDKVVRMIEYSFDKPATDSSLLKQFFASNDSYFSGLFDKPATTLHEVQDIWWQTIQTWENNLVFVKQFIVIGASTYRVRVLVSWKI
jgi:hypothetical protein